MSFENSKVNTSSHYQVVDGYILPRFNFHPEIFREVLKYKPREGEIFIVTYPKCGTTWAQQIVYLILNNAEPAVDGNEFFNNSPFLEKSGIETVKNMKLPNAIKTHLPFELVPYSSLAKYIYVARNPKDCGVSFFHHTKTGLSYNFSNCQMDEYFELYMRGAVDNGDYFDHQMSGYQRKDDANFLYMVYEKMQENPDTSILEMAEFLGKPYKQALELDNVLLKRVIQFSEFGYMKQKVNQYFYDCFKYHHQLIRKGTVAGWKDELSADQCQRLDDKTQLKMGETETYKYWKSIGCI